MNFIWAAAYLKRPKKISESFKTKTFAVTVRNYATANMEAFWPRSDFLDFFKTCELFIDSTIYLPNSLYSYTFMKIGEKSIHHYLSFKPTYFIISIVVWTFYLSDTMNNCYVSLCNKYHTLWCLLPFLMTSCHYLPRFSITVTLCNTYNTL